MEYVSKDIRRGYSQCNPSLFETQTPVSELAFNTPAAKCDVDFYMIRENFKYALFHSQHIIKARNLDIAPRIQSNTKVNKGYFQEEKNFVSTCTMGLYYSLYLY